MKKKIPLKTAARRAVQTIAAFSRRCERDQYTDTGEVWQILGDIRAELRRALRQAPKLRRFTGNGDGYQ